MNKYFIYLLLFGLSLVFVYTFSTLSPEEWLLVWPRWILGGKVNGILLLGETFYLVMTSYFLYLITGGERKKNVELSLGLSIESSIDLTESNDLQNNTINSSKEKLKLDPSIIPDWIPKSGLKAEEENAFLKYQQQEKGPSLFKNSNWKNSIQDSPNMLISEESNSLQEESGRYFLMDINDPSMTLQEGRKKPLQNSLEKDILQLLAEQEEILDTIKNKKESQPSSLELNTVISNKVNAKANDFKGSHSGKIETLTQSNTIKERIPGNLSQKANKIRTLKVVHKAT